MLFTRGQWEDMETRMQYNSKYSDVLKGDIAWCKRKPC